MLQLRYNIPLKNLPTICPCGVLLFEVTHAEINCKKGGFIAKRHNSIKYFLTILLNKVCHDVQLIPVTNEHMRLRTATGVSKRQFSVLNSGIQVSFFRKLPLQNLVFLKFYSLNEEAVRTRI